MAYFLLSNSTRLDKPPDRSVLVLSTKYAIQEQKGPFFWNIPTYITFSLLSKFEILI